MKTDPNTPIAPNMAHYNEGMFAEGGLTKREYIAALVLQGICANQDYHYNDISNAACQAVRQADELIRVINLLKAKAK